MNELVQRNEDTTHLHRVARGTDSSRASSAAATAGALIASTIAAVVRPILLAPCEVTLVALRRAAQEMPPDHME